MSHCLVEENVHSPDAAQRRHGLGQRPLTVSDDSGSIIDVESLAKARAQRLLVAGSRQAQARDHRAHRNVPDAVMRSAVCARPW